MSVSVFFPINVASWGYVHIVAQKAYLFFLKLHYISFFGSTIHGFNQDYVDGYFGCFHSFVITSCAAMGKLIHVTFLACAGISGGRSQKWNDWVFCKCGRYKLAYR